MIQSSKFVDEERGFLDHYDTGVDLVESFWNQSVSRLHPDSP